MTNVQLSLAKDKTFQNLVVTNNATFNTGFLKQLETGILDAGIATIGTLTCQTLNQNNSSVNPFAGVTLAPNQLVALSSTKTLITYPYSQTDTYNTAVQRTSLNGIVDDFISAVGTSNQVVFGTGATTTINVVQTGVLGGIGVGATLPVAQWIVAGDSTVVNTTSGPLQVDITFSGAGTNPNTTLTRVFLDTASGSNNAIIGNKLGGVQAWQINGVQVSPTSQQLDFTPDGSTVLFSMDLNSPPPSVFSVQGNISAIGLASLGNASQRWGPLFLSSAAVQQTGSINGAFVFTTPAGLGTTVAPSLGTRTAALATFTDNQFASNSAIFLNLSSTNFTAGATSPIPMVNYNHGSNQVVFLNAQTSGVQTLTSPLTFSFVALYTVGSGSP